MIAFCCSSLLLSLTLPVGLRLTAMDAGDATQLVAAQERRLANDGRPYTRSEFLDRYGYAGERQWGEAAQQEEAAGRPPAHRDAAQLPAVLLPEHVIAIQQEEASRGPPTDWGVAQLPSEDDITIQQKDPAHGPPADWAVHFPDVLLPEHVAAIQDAEAARGPPRSLHKIARDALNAISLSPTRATVNLDDQFPWRQYVCAHSQNTTIIGPGITHAQAVFVPNTNDLNRGGAQRLNFCFYRTDGTVCLVHPGSKRSQDAQLRIESV